MKRFKNTETGAIIEPQSAFIESVLSTNKAYAALVEEKQAPQVKQKPEKPKEE